MMGDAAMPRVSVVMAVHNEERYVDRAIRSVVRQGLADWELVIVDDASTDSTPQLLQTYTDPRIRVITLTTNSGPGAARNLGIDFAKAEWIAFLDGDDEYEPERLSVLHELGTQNSCDVVCDTQSVIVDSRVVGGMHAHASIERDSQQLTLTRFLVDCPVLTPVIRAGFLRGHGLKFPEDRMYLEDMHLWVSMLLLAPKWIRITAPLYRYHQVANSLSHNRVQLSERKANSLEALASLAMKLGSVSEAHRLRFLAKRAVAQGKTWEFIYAIRERRLGYAMCMAAGNPSIVCSTARVMGKWIVTRLWPT